MESSPTDTNHRQKERKRDWIKMMRQGLRESRCGVELSSSTLEGNFDYAPHLVENTLYQHITKAEEYDSYSAPQWIGYQQKPSYYVEYLKQGTEEGLDIGAQHKPNMSDITTSCNTYMRQKANDVDRKCKQEELKTVGSFSLRNFIEQLVFRQN
uniref:Uncharacterized protein n=1 Tax=Lactuca sativa TaxID=4236 RepID=A0A9R1XFZ6_LACSA|nr:hypothetical protein LSAT_V11C500277640 [Lactuca sativa]